MAARLLAIIATALVACERMSPDEEKLVGSWEARTSPESVTTFAFEPNHTGWCAVTVGKDTWLDGTGRWHTNRSEVVFDDMIYPEVAPDVTAKDPELANPPETLYGKFGTGQARHYQIEWS
jgi:hypothetical protein